MKRIMLTMVAFLMAVVLFVSAAGPVAAARSEREGTEPTPAITCVSTGTETAAPTASLDVIPLPGEGPEDSFYTSTEKVFISSKTDHWRYTSPVLYVDIRKVQDKKKVITYFVADIHMKEPQFRSGVISGRSIPETLAKQFSAVYAQNGDFYTLEKNLKGIIISSGKVYNERKGADTLAIMPDGDLKIFSPGETTAKKLIAMGVRDTWSFGPTLIKNGVMVTNYNRFRNHGKNPRSGFGMIEKGHYIGLVVGGRNPGYSVGMTYLEFAKLFQFYGCKLAYCRDGGASASMVFMGKPMDLRIRMTGSAKLTKRRVPDIFIIGKSSLVPKK
jgi:exopolysaccharide biosynthesis protein